jgi:hypothetical protein
VIVASASFTVTFARAVEQIRQRRFAVMSI